MKVAHQSRVRAVGLVPMYFRASETSLGQPNKGRDTLASCGRAVTGGGAAWVGTGLLMFGPAFRGLLAGFICFEGAARDALARDWSPPFGKGLLKAGILIAMTAAQPIAIAKPF